jgi:biotin--protein ligase
MVLCVCLFNSGSVVRLASRGEEAATILGIDDYGYLQVRTNKTQELLSLQPDGNTFDIMKGLIATKPT